MDLVRLGQVEEGIVLITDFQNAGKGQRGNKWIADRGQNLIMSTYLKPRSIPVSNLFLMSKIVALAIHQSLSELTGLHFQIKWPNDILFQGKKIAGILIENIIQGKFLNQSIIGIGININQDQFPPFDRQATALSMITNKQYDILKVCQSVCQSLEYYYLQVIRQDKKDMIDQFYLNNLYLFNTSARFSINDNVLMGRIVNVLDSGHIELKVGTTSQTLDIKELKFLE